MDGFGVNQDLSKISSNFRYTESTSHCKGTKVDCGPTTRH